jgi:hypothetical protein
LAMIKEVGVLAIAAFIAIAVIVSIYLVKRGTLKMEIRRIAALDAIDMAIGRATEMGRPVHFTHGTAGGLYAGLAQGEAGAQIVAAMGVLSYVSELCAKYNVQLICTICHAETMPLYTDTIQLGFLKGGRPQLWNSDIVRFISPYQFAFTAGAMATISREKPAASFLVGPLYAESLLLAEVGYNVGAIQISGSAYTHQLPFLVAACDYTLIGEELYAAGVYLSKNPVLLGSIGAQDLTKILVMIFIGAASVLLTMGVNVMKIMGG